MTSRGGCDPQIENYSLADPGLPIIFWWFYYSFGFFLQVLDVVREVITGPRGVCLSPK